MSFWGSDFEWSWRGVTVKETGADVRFDGPLFYDIWRWAVYTTAEKLRSFSRQKHAVSVDAGTIRPWYLLWAVVTRAGGRLVSPDYGDRIKARIHFSDQTFTAPQKPANDLFSLNFSCNDISKSRVAGTFKNVFGYDLSVDPETYDKDMVVKSEDNGAHDGKIMPGPTAKQPNMVYQRLIDNATDDGHVRDLRCPTLMGKPCLVFIKERPIDQRFDNLNTRCRLEKPEDLFSDDELSKISQFCQKMKLDFGGLDILRDKGTGRIYIVDVNKTDMGPPLALPLREKLRAVDIIAEQFKAVVFAPESG